MKAVAALVAERVPDDLRAVGEREIDTVREPLDRVVAQKRVVRVPEVNAVSSGGFASRQRASA